MSINVNSEARKSPEQLEREIDERRAHLSGTLEELEERFSPEHLVDQVLQYTRRNGGDFSHNLVETIKNNPIPTILTTVGLVWMMSSRNQPDSAQYNREYSFFHDEEEGFDSSAFVAGSDNDGSLDYAYETGDGAGKKQDLRDKAGAAKDKMSETKDKAGQAVKNAGARAQQSAESLRHKSNQARQRARYQAQRINQSFEHMLKEQPLAVGAIGVAIGALIGASLPSTDTEDRLMGSARDRTVNKGAAVAKAAYDKGKDTGHKVKEDVKRDIQTDQRGYRV